MIIVVTYRVILLLLKNSRLSLQFCSIHYCIEYFQSHWMCNLKRLHEMHKTLHQRRLLWNQQHSVQWEVNCFPSNSSSNSDRNLTIQVKSRPNSPITLDQSSLIQQHKCCTMLKGKLQHASSKSQHSSATMIAVILWKTLARMMQNVCVHGLSK